MVLAAIGEWYRRYGQRPTSYDWSRTRAHRRGGEALERLGAAGWPPPSVVSRRFGTWAGARSAAVRVEDLRQPDAG
jgi:hypothetical protein